MLSRLLRLQSYMAFSKSHPHPPQIAYKTDAYRSVHLSLTSPLPEKDFIDYIDKILKIELEENKKVTHSEQTNAIWVHLTPQYFSFAKYLCEVGFVIHHGINQQLSLYRWIASKKDLVTPYSTNYVSCGALVIHNGKVLLVQQKNGTRKGDYGIPGGRSDFGQSVASCAQRELFQETNIKAKFRYVLSFRELQKMLYGGMDMYFVCVMDFQESELQNLKMCDREIMNFEWVPLEEYDTFASKNCNGTQLQLSKYVKKLFKIGFDFKNSMPNQILQERYVSPKDKVQRCVVQHGMVQGITIDKSY